jgi:hypothetical protein
MLAGLLRTSSARGFAQWLLVFACVQLGSLVADSLFYQRLAYSPLNFVKFNLIHVCSSSLD